jgi:hypothetical protein
MMYVTIGSSSIAATSLTTLQLLQLLLTSAQDCPWQERWTKLMPHFETIRRQRHRQFRQHRQQLRLKSRLEDLLQRQYLRHQRRQQLLQLWRQRL